MNISLTKVNGKVVKAVAETGTFTTEKVDVRTKDHKGPVYDQLVIEPGQITLQSDVTEDRVAPIRKTIIKDSGAYEQNFPLFTARGQCQVREKAF